MRAYISNIKISVHIQLMYPFEVWMKVIARLLFTYLQVVLWETLFLSNGQIGNSFSSTETLSYILMVNLVYTFMFGNVISWINDQIRTGNILYDLLRPVNYCFLSASRYIGETIINICFKTIPMILVSLIFWRKWMVFNDHWLWFSISLLLGYLINYFYSYIIGLLAFWLIESWPLNMFLSAIYKLMSGMWIPVFLFPDSLKKVSAFMPYKYIYSTPVMIITNEMSSVEIYIELGIQFFWLIFIVLLMLIVWKAGKRHLVIQGG